MVLSREDLLYMKNMNILHIILVVFMVGALGTVIVGVVAMAVNGKLNKNHSNKILSLLSGFLGIKTNLSTRKIFIFLV